MGILKSCKPRKDVLKGDLDDAIFAADFGDLLAGKAPPVYGDPKVFFQNTHPAKQLRNIVAAVFSRLNSRKEGGATMRLSTGFGGGKTHTLMALWHLAQHIQDVSLGTELLPAAGRPQRVTVAAIDAHKAGVPDFAVHGRLRVHSLWGEVFYALAGEKGLKALGKADNPEASPNEQQITSVLPKGPILILLDELVIYMAKLSDRGQGNLLGFLNLLASVVSKRPQTVLLITDPGKQTAYATESAQLEKGIQRAAERLDDVADRKFSDFDPIGDESARVIIRRLFDRVDRTAAQAASATYHALYERVLQENPGALPADAVSPEYAGRIVECYPFHPRLLDTATDRLGALQDFQKSRGVLRLFARILRDVWEAKRDLELITAGEINWSSSRIQADLLHRLNRAEFRAAIKADIERHASELDGGNPDGIHRRVASALLLESIPLQSNSGLEPADLTLAVLRPDEAGPEPAEAMDRLMGVCWHTYPMASGRGCQFRYQPNLHKQIEERMSEISIEDARSRVLAEAQHYFQGTTFRLCAWPTSAKQVPEHRDLQLVLCEDEATAKAVVAYADDSDPSAPMPRAFQNAILAVTATASALGNAVERARRLMAADAIEKEHRTGDAARLVREQMKRIKPELEKQFALQTRRAFDRIILPGGTVRHLDEKYQVSEEQMLKRPAGQGCLKKFLDENRLIYQPDDTLDVPRFLENVLPGTTPLADQPEVYTARAVHERFLQAPGLRLVPDGSIVRRTLLKALQEGKLVIRLADGSAYDREGCVKGPPGRRQRVRTSEPPQFALDESVWVAPADSEAARTWLKTDEVRKAPAEASAKPEIKEPPSRPEAPPTAMTWPKAIENADRAALLELILIADNPNDAATLIGIAQPFGADKLSLTVWVSGELKDGGRMNFMAEAIKPTHPAKPLAIAQTIFNSLAAGGEFEAKLQLDFGQEGRTGMRERLEQAAQAAPEGVEPRARFGKRSEESS